jgi:hypothetical protein
MLLNEYDLEKNDYLIKLLLVANFCQFKRGGGGASKMVF